MQDKKSILEPDGVYHIYNRANGNELLFVDPENYRFFLEKYKQYVSPVVDTLSYCLMPNHFHFLVRVKGDDQLIGTFPKFAASIEPNLQGFRNLEGFISQQFSNLFNAYAKAFNKKYSRKRNLFMHTFKRKKVTNEKYLLKLIHYIHYNPVEADMVEKPEEWKFSSYKAILSQKESLIEREEVISLFGDINNFLHCHTQEPLISGMEDY